MTGEMSLTAHANTEDISFSQPLSALLLLRLLRRKLAPECGRLDVRLG